MSFVGTFFVKRNKHDDVFDDVFDDVAREHVTFAAYFCLLQILQRSTFYFVQRFILSFYNVCV